MFSDLPRNYFKIFKHFAGNLNKSNFIFSGNPYLMTPSVFISKWNCIMTVSFFGLQWDDGDDEDDVYDEDDDDDDDDYVMDDDGGWQWLLLWRWRWRATTRNNLQHDHSWGGTYKNYCKYFLKYLAEEGASLFDLSPFLKFTVSIKLLFQVENEKILGNLEKKVSRINVFSRVYFFNCLKTVKYFVEFMWRNINFFRCHEIIPNKVELQSWHILSRFSLKKNILTIIMTTCFLWKLKR